MNTNNENNSNLRIFKYFESGKINPAIIISGKNSEARLSIAKKLTKFLLCQKKINSHPCETCRTCSRIDREIHPDVLIIKETEVIKISTIREIIEQMEYGPIEEKYKICIIIDAERMNTPSANAFLKTLEEPLNNRIFLLLTGKVHSLLPTVLSRCVEFNLNPEEEIVSAENIKNYEKLMNQLKLAETIGELQNFLPDEKACKNFILFLQSKLKESLIKNYRNDNICTDIFSCHDDIVQVEKIISTNANPILAIEAFLRKHFLDTPLWGKIYS